MEKKISVIIHTYNASRYLEQVLEAVKDFDEIVICDMESTDNTLKIAKKYKCRVISFPKGNNVSAEPARTFAIQSASNHWVLVVDADEIVTPELKNYLYDRICSKDCPQGLYIPRRNMFLGKYERGFTADHQLRFFIKEGTVWPPFVHTFPKVQGRVDKIPANSQNICICHLADESIAQITDKNNRYSDGEVSKKRNKKYGIVSLLFKPQWKFFSEYILHGGFLNGTRGLIKAGIKATYQFTLIAKIIEEDIRAKQ